jgi:PhoH-like ATPase
LINYTPKIKNSFVVLDTSALVHDPSCIDYYKGHTVVVTGTVLQELDKLKDKLIESKACNVRRAMKSLERYTEAKGDIMSGITLPETNVTVQFVAEQEGDSLPAALSHKIPDDRILSVCLSLAKKHPKKEVVLVSNDINLGLKASMYGIRNEKYQDKLLEVSAFSGYRDEPLPESKTLTIEKLLKAKSNGVAFNNKKVRFQENEFFLLQGDSAPIRCFYREGRVFPLPTGTIEAAGIKELNLEQAYALNLLLDPNVKLITITGLAGCGKTLLSMAAAIDQVLDREEPLYEKIIVSRSLTVLGGKDRLGFLPGDLKSKLQPFILPLRDALEQILGADHDIYEVVTGDLEATKFGKKSGKSVKPLIEVEPLQYIRGRNIRNSFMIVDEAQNLTEQEIKTITTRMCDHSKLILMGDLDQIDNFYVSRTSNGLAQTIEKFKDCSLAGHVNFTRGVRSALATEASKRLGG